MPAPIDTGYSAALARIQEITGVASRASSLSGSGMQSFATQLSHASGSLSDAEGVVAGQAGQTPFTYGAGALAVGGATPPGGTTFGGAGPVGQRIAQLAMAELGVAESPKGSNDSPRIAEYRTATQGAGVGPWCSYFTSWVARQAGVPVGPNGRGEGWVPNVESWGKQTGRWIEPDAQTPQAGDLVVFDRNGDGLTDHIGVVTGVRNDGGITTIEGNSSDQVSERSYGAGEYAGFVRLVRSGV